MGLPFFSYMLRCSDGSYYVGHTDNMEKRLSEHMTGEGCVYTRSRLPITVVWAQEFPTRDEARAAEAQLKRWSRAKKEALIEGRFDIISRLASRSAKRRTLRDVLPQGRTPQGCGGNECSHRSTLGGLQGPTSNDKTRLKMAHVL